MIGYFLQQKNVFADEARYVFRQMAKMMSVKMLEVMDVSHLPANLDLLLVYSDNIPKIKTDVPRIFIAQSDYSRLLALTQQDIGTLVAKQSGLPEKIFYFTSNEIPHLPTRMYVDLSTAEVMISRNDNCVHCAVDIVSTCFYFLSLENERRATDRDLFHRFQRNFSPVGEELYDYPVVDRYAAMLRQLLLELIPGFAASPVWPEGKTFAVALSHDVDRLHTWTLHKAKRALRTSNSPHKNPILRFLRLAQSVVYPENWLGNFNYISRLEQRFGAASTFFFVARHRHELDPTYKLDSRLIRQGMELLQKRGCEIALHGTIFSSTQDGFLELEKEDIEFLINNDIKGGRQHYLCFTAETPQFWQNAQLKYDSTLGFSYHTGFRCGTSFPFYFFDGKKEWPIVEIPLVLMDTVLFLESKQFLSAEDAWQVIERHLEETRNNNGLLTINWHNSDLHPYDVYGYSQLYMRILKWAQERNGWLASLNQVYEWWQAK